jgi:hypothetical protein
MGYTSYSSTARTVRHASINYAAKSASQIFSQRMIHNAMDPRNAANRESRDSKEHPNTFPVIIALDVTGSMGKIPEYILRTGLPHIMDSIIGDGCPDVQIMFVAIGDHECDRAPLQIGQFESGDAELDQWLTSTYIEGNGGGNDGESYHLAWYYASNHTSTDHNEKRNGRGVLITIGDEKCLRSLSSNYIKGIMGDNGNLESTNSENLFKLAKEKYNVFHIHVAEGSNGTRQDVTDSWKQIIGQNLLIAEDYTQIPKIIAKTVQSSFESEPKGSGPQPFKLQKKENVTPSVKPTDNTPNML